MAEIKFSCPHCQQHIQAESAYFGLQIACPACNGSLTVPGAPPAPAPTSARLSIRTSVPASATPTPEPAPAVEQPPPAPGTGACPSCSSPMARGAILCRNCGYNLSTGQRTVAGRPAAPGKPRELSGENPWYLTPWPYVGAVMVLLGIFYLLGRENPAMMVGFVAVAVLYAGTIHIIVLVAAFRESVGIGFLTLCIPFYAIYFVYKVNDNDTLRVLYGFALIMNLALKFLELRLK